jgi:hypothetical protein
LCIDIALGHLKAGVRSECIAGGKPALIQPRDYGFKKFDHFDPGHPVRSQGRRGGVTESEAAHEDRKSIPRVETKTELRQSPFGLGVVAAHQKTLVEGDLGNDDSRTREQLAAAQAQFSQACVLVVQNFEEWTH